MTKKQELAQLELKQTLTFEQTRRSEPVRELIRKLLPSEYWDRKKRIAELRSEIESESLKADQSRKHKIRSEFSDGAKYAMKAFSGVCWGGEIVLLSEHKNRFLFKKLTGTAYVNRLTGTVTTPVRYFCVDSNLISDGSRSCGAYLPGVVFTVEGRQKQKTMDAMYAWVKGANLPKSLQSRAR